MYRGISLLLSVVFAGVGVVFLLFPDGVLSLFNALSRSVGMTESPLHGTGFYQILAVGYMYIVSLLAYLMYRHPENRDFPWLLINAKGASVVISLYIYIAAGPYLIYIANAAVDGSIAAGLIALTRRMRRGPA